MQAYQNANEADFRCQYTINPNLTQAVRYWASEFDVPPSKLLEVRKRLST